MDSGCDYENSRPLNSRGCGFPARTQNIRIAVMQKTISIAGALRTAFVFLFLALPACAMAQQSGMADNTTVPDYVARILRGHNLPAGSYSFVVQEIGANEPLLSVNAGSMMNPASTIKTVTTFAALELLGPAYTWQTELYALGPVESGVLQGDLLLRGGGDPFLVEEQLRAMLKALQRAGVTHIKGNLLLDGSYFDASVTEANRIDNQGGRAYNTNPNAVLANFQAVTFYFYPHGNGRDVVIVSDPHLPNLAIDNRLRQTDGACVGYQRGVSFAVNGTNPAEVIFSGRFPSRCTRYSMTREVLTAPDYTFGLFKALWQELGGTLDGSAGVGVLPDDVEPILTWSSSPLSDVIKSINKFSNNLMTRHLLLTLGAERFEVPATVEKGRQAIIEFLQGRNLDTAQLNLVNGSGLSRDVRITAAFLNDLLQQAWDSPWMPEYIASMPVNGMDGTMRSRLRGSMAGRMHIKTGTLDEVSAVAGYVQSQSGRRYTVVGMVNHELADRGPGTELTDALLGWVYSR